MIYLKINNIDKSDQIDWSSIEKTEVLTKEPDLLRFRVKNYGAKTYRPAIGDDVTLFENATKIFGGIVVDTSDSTDGFLQYFNINCKDYTHTLDRFLVAQTYTGMIGDAIIADILSTSAPTFTDTNVNAPIVVEKIVFNYMSVSETLKKLSKYLGNYDWFVDYDKDIHFFETTTNPAPFNLTDTSGNFVWNSLVLEENIQQLRNHIIIRGGDIEGDLVSNIQVSDGVQRVFFIGYSLALSSLLIEKALSATPTTFVTQTVGADGKDNPASFNCLYNPNNGLVIFPDGTKPAVNDRIKSEGYPIFPLIAEKQDLVSVGNYGVYQYLIVDTTIKSREAASQMADGELLRYSQPFHRAGFDTYNSGLRTGQIINVSSVIRNLNKDYLIERISTVLDTPTSLKYQVTLLASEDVTMIDVLNRLVGTNVTDQISIGENEVVNTLYSAFETIDLSESFVISLSHNPINETITLGEVETVQPLDYATIFVMGFSSPYIPTILYNGADTKRQFILDGSPLG